MPDMFEQVKNRWSQSPSLLIIYFLSIVMVIIGANHFIEDTWSSYLGLKSLETYFQMNVQIFEWTYWTMSIAPQIAAMVFFYIFLADTKRTEYLWGSVGSQIIDLAADVWYRSNEQLFSSPAAAIGALLITFLFFTIGCEVFLTVGFGLILKLSKPVHAMWKLMRGDTRGSYGSQTTTYQPKPHPNPSHNYSTRPENRSSQPQKRPSKKRRGFFQENEFRWLPPQDEE